MLTKDLILHCPKCGKKLEIVFEWFNELSKNAKREPTTHLYLFEYPCGGDPCFGKTFVFSMNKLIDNAEIRYWKFEKVVKARYVEYENV